MQGGGNMRRLLSTEEKGHSRDILSCKYSSGSMNFVTHFKVLFQPVYFCLDEEKVAFYLAIVCDLVLFNPLTNAFRRRPSKT